jgi:uncharacterized protein YgbK (DUF1537 family)
MQLPISSVGLIADDLTGACDTALQFFCPQTQARILVTLPENPATLLPSTTSGQDARQNTVWALNTASRHCSPREAQALARNALALCRDFYGVDHYYKKIDSTLRGHIAQECLGLLEELKAQCAVIVPAYPAEGRRTVGGYQLVRGVPVERTIAARDPLFPVRQSHVPTLLAQSAGAELVGHISLSDVLHGAGPILVKMKELVGQGCKLLVVDAATNEDLEQIALAIEKARKYAQILPCGSAGLARALANLWAEMPCQDMDEAYSLQSTPSPLLMVIGSNTETTRQQLRKLIEHYAYFGHDSHLEVFELPPEIALGLVPSDSLIRQIKTALGERNTVVISSAATEDSYGRTMALAQEHGLSDSQASRLVQETLGTMTRILSELAGDFKLLLAGGETTCHVCDALNAHELQIIAEVEASIPLTQDATGRWIITKSGGFGSPMVLANAVRFIKQRETLSLEHAS